jgi:hypothetical protein
MKSEDDKRKMQEALDTLEVGRKMWHAVQLGKVQNLACQQEQSSI